MKKVLESAFLALMLASVCVAQNQPAQPATGQPAQTQPAQPQQPAGTRRPPEARSDSEFKAYNEFRRLPAGQQAEAAAKEFESKFPQSELRGLIYQNLMDGYRAADNPDKVVEMGRKSLSFDPDNPLVLVMVATVLAERTRDTDPNPDQQYGEAMQDAKRALETMNKGLAVQPGMPPEKVAEIKQLLTAMAHSAMGWIELKKNQDAAAEQDLRQAAQLNVMQPDPMVYLRLAIALDHQSKYADALAAVNKVLEISPNGGVADLARQEKERLQSLLKPAPAANPAAPAPPPATTPQPPPSTPPKG